MPRKAATVSAVAKSEDRPVYAVTQADSLAEEERIIQAALEILNRRMQRFSGTLPFTCPQSVKDFLRLKIGGLEHEVFFALWLDSQNRLLDTEELFRGTLTQCSVYAREVVKAAIVRNAGAVIFAHNHPSGAAEPSSADELLTSELKRALALVDVRVLDHIIVGTDTVSFAERGLI